MDDINDHTNEFISFKIIQSGEIIKVSLSRSNLGKKFDEIYGLLLKKLKLKQKNTYLSNENGKMVGDLDLELSLQEIIKKFGNKLKVYYEKIF